VEGSNLPNVICHLRGQKSGTVIVGAHYDRSTVARPIDNWSGAALLPALYQCLRAKRRHHSYIFVAFADHDKSLTGAKFFSDHLSSVEAAHAEAMVNLDVLGLSPTKVWSARSDKDLVHDLLTMVYALKLPASQIDLSSEEPTDGDPFSTRGIPPITIHSLTQQNLIEGATTSFRPDNYYDTYRLLCGYLAYLDEILKPRPN
jgi:Zn-dependent M28 family amino/carboxypeptidase